MKDHIPDAITCSKCKRILDVREYYGIPDEETPAEWITEIIDPNYPQYSVHCSNCGQYTVSRPKPKIR